MPALKGTKKFSAIYNSLRKIAKVLKGTALVYSSENKQAFIDYVQGTATKLTKSDLNGATAIGAYKFRNYTALESIEIPDSVTSIGSYAFYNTTFKTIKIPASVTSVGDYCIQKNTALTSVTIAAKTTGSYFCADCTSLSIVNLEPGITSIGSYAFQKCANLHNINFPEGITSIGDLAFSETSLGAITFPSTLVSIGASSFHKTLIKTLPNFPSGMSTITGGAFSSCYNLTAIENIPANITTIATNAFGYCSGVKRLVIPTTVTTVGKGAFFGLTSLEYARVTQPCLQGEFGPFYYDSGSTSSSYIDETPATTIVFDSVSDIKWAGKIFPARRNISLVNPSSDLTQDSTNTIIWKKDPNSSNKYPALVTGGVNAAHLNVNTIWEYCCYKVYGPASVNLLNLNEFYRGAFSNNQFTEASWTNSSRGYASFSGYASKEAYLNGDAHYGTFSTPSEKYYSDYVAQANILRGANEEIGYYRRNQQ